MKIELNTLSEMPITIDSYGDKVSILLNLDRHSRDQPFALVEKAMFGGKGEIFTQDSFIKFKSNYRLLDHQRYLSGILHNLLRIDSVYNLMGHSGIASISLFL